MTPHSEEVGGVALITEMRGFDLVKAPSGDQVPAPVEELLSIYGHDTYGRRVNGMGDGRRRGAYSLALTGLVG